MFSLYYASYLNFDFKLFFCIFKGISQQNSQGELKALDIYAILRQNFSLIVEFWKGLWNFRKSLNFESINTDSKNGWNFRKIYIGSKA